MTKLFWIVLSVISAYASSVWNKENLYDKVTMSYYIPYELWLQIPWNGKKQRVFHNLKQASKIQGAFNWYHPYLKKHLQVYKTHDNSTKLYTLYSKGITQVYDEKGEVFLNNGIHFPSGFGWKEKKIYTFSEEIWIKNKHYVRPTAIQINDIIFDDQDNLDSLSFNLFINGTLKEQIVVKPIK